MKINYYCLQRSHVKSSLKPLVVTYLILAAIVSSVIVGISLVGEPEEEIVSGLLFATDIPGLDVSEVVNVTKWKAQPRSVQSIRFVRLIPVPDQLETEAKLPPDRLEARHDFVLPTYYCPIFSERDLMEKLARPCCEIIYYTITDERLGLT